MRWEVSRGPTRRWFPLIHPLLLGASLQYFSPRQEILQTATSSLKLKLSEKGRKITNSHLSHHLRLEVSLSHFSHPGALRVAGRVQPCLHKNQIGCRRLLNYDKLLACKRLQPRLGTAAWDLITSYSGVQCVKSRRQPTVI